MSPILLAVTVKTLPLQLGQIFYFIVLPILILAGIGYLLQRTLGLDMQTLSRLNFYFIIPGVIYFSLLSSKLSGKDAGTVVLFSLAMVVCLGLVTSIAALIARVPRERRSPMLMTTMFYNSGNYGLPLQDLAFRSAGMGAQAVMLQVFVMIIQNITSLTLGVFLAASGRKDRHWKHHLLEVLKFPPVYALAAALITLEIKKLLGATTPGLPAAFQPFWTVLSYVREAYIGVALCALGAQVALIARGGQRYPITLNVILRLLGGPAVGLGLIYLVGLKGFLAQVLLVSTSTPTSVNAMLLSVQFDNQPDYVARSVFYSTLLSPVTITLVIFMAQAGFLPGLTLP